MKSSSDMSSNKSSSVDAEGEAGAPHSFEALFEDCGLQVSFSIAVENSPGLRAPSEDFLRPLTLADDDPSMRRTYDDCRVEVGDCENIDEPGLTQGKLSVVVLSCPVVIVVVSCELISSCW